MHRTIAGSLLMRVEGGVKGYGKKTGTDRLDVGWWNRLRRTNGLLLLPFIDTF